VTAGAVKANATPDSTQVGDEEAGLTDKERGCIIAWLENTIEISGEGSLPISEYSTDEEELQDRFDDTWSAVAVGSERRRIDKWREESQKDT
jgi:hypothetical protein